MEHIPHKRTLPELVLARLREGIDSGEWKEILPAERSLSKSLQVSRSTLRLAIAQLRSEGWLEVAGKRTLIRRRPSLAKSEVMRTRRIVFLSPHPLEQLPALGLFVYGELSRRLAPMGATIYIETVPALSPRRMQGYLDKLVTDIKPDAWILHRSPIEIHQYFQSSPTPAVIFGNAHEGITIPALDIDYCAALRHCLSSLSRLGHSPEQLSLVVPCTPLAGNIELGHAFRDFVGEGSAANILRHLDNGDDVARLLERSSRREPQPSAFIVLRTSVAAKVHGLLQQRHGKAIPGDVSLACLEDSPFMSHLVPEISRYHVDSAKVAQFIFNTLSRQLSTGVNRSWKHRPFVPEFVAGETLGTASG